MDRIANMPSTNERAKKSNLPRRWVELVRLLPPQAIRDDVQPETSLDMIDRLMVAGRLSADQSVYLETLVQLVQAYEAAHHAIDTSDISGLACLKHLLSENEMNASDLARVLDMHPSMGSKILNGDRSLTLEHVRKLATRFKVSPGAFMD